MRYCSHYAPLFSRIPTPTGIVKVNNIHDLCCYRIIAETAANARRCRDILRSNRDNTPLTVREGFEAFHYDRIKDAHLSYIGIFRRYLKAHYIDKSVDNEVTPESRKLYSKLVAEIGDLVELYDPDFGVKYGTSKYENYMLMIEKWHRKRDYSMEGKLE